MISTAFVSKQSQENGKTEIFRAESKIPNFHDREDFVLFPQMWTFISFIVWILVDFSHAAIACFDLIENIDHYPCLF